MDQYNLGTILAFAINAILIENVVLSQFMGCCPFFGVSKKSDTALGMGMAVTFISSEVEEMLRTCSRMAVLRDGEKVGELEESELSQSNIMKAIAGGDDKNE